MSLNNFLKRISTDVTIWDILKEFINSINVNETFTRPQMLEYLEKFNLSTHRHTPDCYRNDLCHCRFIMKTDKRGVYTKLRDIPEWLTISQARKLGYDKSWREWFIPEDKKLKLLEQKLKELNIT